MIRSPPFLNPYLLYFQLGNKIEIAIHIYSVTWGNLAVDLAVGLSLAMAWQEEPPEASVIWMATRSRGPERPSQI